MPDNMTEAPDQHALSVLRATLSTCVKKGCIDLSVNSVALGSDLYLYCLYMAYDKCCPLQGKSEYHTFLLRVCVWWGCVDIPN